MKNNIKNILILVLSGFIVISWANNKQANGTTIIENAVGIDDPCTKLDQYYREYIKAIEERIEGTVSIDSLNSESKKDLPIRQKVGESYINAYKYKRRPGKTQFVTLNIRTVAFFYKYMVENKVESLAFCFARYKLKRGLNDQMLGNDPDRKKRGTMVVGVFDNNKKLFRPFRFHFKWKRNVEFYDDWNDVWP